jgi:transposase
VRRKEVAPLVNDLIEWMKRERAKLSRHNPVAKATDYMLRRIGVFTRFLADGRICLSNNAAERALRGIALGRKSWLFAGSDRGGERAAVMLTLIHTAKLNGIDPKAWLADVLTRIADHKIADLAALLPWNWRQTTPVARAA